MKDHSTVDVCFGCRYQNDILMGNPEKCRSVDEQNGGLFFFFVCNDFGAKIESFCPRNVVLVDPVN